jgi:hypothetical protein
MTAAPSDKSTAVIPMPLRLEETGLGADLIEQILIKTLQVGEVTGLMLADRLCLTFSILEPLIERTRAERLVEVRGTVGTGSASYRYALTDAGRDRARRYMELNQYIGPAPVTLASYTAQMHALAAAGTFIDREQLAEAFSHLVLGENVLEQVGPAVNASKAVFLYGPPGNGKTVIAEGMGRALGGDMLIPHAVEVEGHIMTMFDPIMHHRLEVDAPSTSIVATAPRDRRWLKIRRPVVIVGGELTLDMLDLTFNPQSRFYEAPIQLKANGGVFLIDDFGRQRMRPQDLLNRWIVPLESRVDYLTLHTGKKFQVPFDVLTVFATNLAPASLADEAFLRRIPYKIQIGDPDVEQFTKIFELNCRRRKMRFHQVMVAYLYRRHYRPLRRPLRACQPRDLIDQVVALCRYRGVEPTITRELLDAACAAYFIDEPDAAIPPPAQPKRRRHLEIH